LPGRYAEKPVHSPARGPAERLTALVITFNLVIFLAFAGLLTEASIGLIYKIFVWMAVSCIYNALALAAYIYRDQVNEFFQYLKGGMT
jgi:hypothetical protein